MSCDVTWMDVSVTVPLSAENRALFVPPFTLNVIEVNMAEVPCNLKRAVGLAGDLSEEKVFVGTVLESAASTVRVDADGKIICIFSAL